MNNVLDYFKRLLEFVPSCSPVSAEEKVESLKLIVEEQNRDYDYLLHIYDRMRATESVLLTASFGVVAYLYYSAPLGNRTSIAQRLSVPSEDYGKVIYFIAFAFFGTAVIKLMMNVFGNNIWETAYEVPKEKYSHKPVETLGYIKQRYDHCIVQNGIAYGKRKKELLILFYGILVSAIILIVTKTLR